MFRQESCNAQPSSFLLAVKLSVSVSSEQWGLTLCHRHVLSFAAAVSSALSGRAGACFFSSDRSGAVPLIMSRGFRRLVTTEEPSCKKPQSPSQTSPNIPVGRQKCLLE